MVEDIFSLEGKRALVTGGSRGIGRAIAIGFAEAGADVAVTARSVGALDEVAGHIEDMGRRGAAIPCDATDPEQVVSCIEKGVGELGGVDVLVNNAGGGTPHPFAEIDEEIWDESQSINLRSAFLFCRYAGRRMLEQGSGSIVNISSGAGLRGGPTLAHYGAAKAGLLNLTQALSREWARAGIRVNAVCPGWTKTALTEDRWGDDAIHDAYAQAIPMGRWGEPEEVVGAAVFLASEAAGYVTGVTIAVDGGISGH